ncbi:DUF1963 domain-containing protein [Anatilimnocola floriformis]|uniref:DUF1963 domain-containing protein n=1 Tax=Anatilimnocola floriformis TaxID=2948575 RepID=UPI0020C34B37|nr:DUF1963 domain-containing protein [Anatilimnocola floriformis]
MPWPTNGDEPLQFLAQLPLDCLGSFPPGSLLTLFRTDRLASEGRDNGSHCVFILRGDNLAEREPPAPDMDFAQSAIVLEESSEIPDWPIVVEALKYEFEKTDVKPFQKFRREEFPKYATAPNVSRLGGWPGWTQSPEAEDPLIAQISFSDYPPGDGGCLYVCQNGTGGLDMYLQYD